MGIEKSPHEIIRVPLEIAPLVFVGETYGRDVGPCGKRTQGSHLLRREWPVYGEEFVILVLTHGV